jgi:hypothetical protein
VRVGAEAWPSSTRAVPEPAVRIPQAGLDQHAVPFPGAAPRDAISDDTYPPWRFAPPWRGEPRDAQLITGATQADLGSEGPLRASV